jgi:hypothetical protein
MRGLSVTVGVLCTCGAAMAAPAGAPDFTGLWQHTPIAEYQAVPGKPGPIFDLKHPLSPTFLGVILEGNWDNPILQPWAAAALRKHSEGAHSGHLIPTPTEECRPSGVPNALTLTAPVEFLQLPDEVMILYQRDHQVRHVRMNVAHSAAPEPSWYGESVGYYDGDTLVVDTIGLNDRTPVDIFGTPHTRELHVVERYRLIDGGKNLEAVFSVEDEGAFTTPWWGRMVYGRVNAPQLAEEVCAENDLDVVTQQPYPIPRAAKANF